MNILEMMNKVNAPVSASGHEAGIRDVLGSLITGGDERWVDTLGNLIVKKNGTAAEPKKIMLSAHMDSIGVIVTHIDDNGFISFASIGGLTPALLLSVPVKFASKAQGVISLRGKVKVSDLKISDLFIDIGVSCREDAEKQVAVGDVGVYAACGFENNGRIFTPYLDDRIACLILIEVLNNLGSVPNDLYFVFSTQEELGLRGATTAAFGIEPDIGLAVDVTRTGDTPDIAVPMECAVGKGAAIKIKDSSLVCSPDMVRTLGRIAKQNGIKHQFEVLEAGGTDAGAIQRSRAGAVTGAVSIPTRYIHSQYEMCDAGDVSECIKLISSFVKEA